MNRLTGSLVAMAAVIGVFCVALGVAGVDGTEHDTESPPATTVVAAAPQEAQRQVLEGKVNQLAEKVNALVRVRADLDGKRDTILGELRKSGIRSKDDLPDHPVGRKWAELLQRNRQEYARYSLLHDQYQVALIEGRDVLERIGRQQLLRDAGITERELGEITATIRKIDESVRIEPPLLDALQIEEVLEQELNRPD